MAVLQRSLRHSFRSTASRCYTSSLDPRHYIQPSDVELPEDFTLFPKFLNDEEQRVLLASALRELDDHGSRAARRNLKRTLKDKDVYRIDIPTVQDLFLPEESQCYDFEKGHFDGVIQHFREMHISRWTPSRLLEPVLRRLRTLLPPTLPQDSIVTHILHLSSKGQILPHVDNADASGSWVAAVSLGHERVLRMEGPTNFEVLLPSGSAYVQKDTVRYSYRHSILKDATFKNSHITSAQRLSVILRDRFRPGVQ